MEFYIVCRVCKEKVEERELFTHLKTHDPILYYDVIPKLKWQQ